MRGLIRCVWKLFCTKSNSPETATMPRGMQNRGSGPKPVENISDAATAGQGPVQGTSKNDQELLNDLLGFLDKRIQDETSNPRRRESIQLCRNFVNDHGYPVEDYCIYAWATHGIVKVLTDDETKTLPHTVEHASESYALGAPEIDLRSFS
ncbi:hypothetical protein F5883DRAFT_18333 [Diaporthe sp. PMI_573]|nr:hypothetical protein F5883DRAFT_18333 [Diaporthaceae sp. PMI_573]